MEQMPLFTSNHQQISGAGREIYGDLANSAMNKLGVEDRAVHSWYRFVLSFPPHLVDEYIARFKLETNRYSRIAEEIFFILNNRTTQRLNRKRLKPRETRRALHGVRFPPGLSRSGR